MTSAQQGMQEQGRREQGKERRRRRILDAAAQLVENDGLDGLTMRRLSETAGVSYATVYNLIGSKEDVLVALLRSGLEDLGAQLAAVASRDPLDRARGLVAGVVDHFVGRPALYRALVQAVHDPAAGTAGCPDPTPHDRVVRDLDPRHDGPGLAAGRPRPARARLARHAGDQWRDQALGGG